MGAFKMAEAADLRRSSFSQRAMHRLPLPLVCPVNQLLSANTAETKSSALDYWALCNRFVVHKLQGSDREHR